MLRDLNELTRRTKESYKNTFFNNDFKLNRDFKDRFSRAMEAKNNEIQYFNYSAEITINKGNKIFCPNQWFYLATFVVPYLSELLKYKRIIDKLANSSVNGMPKNSFMEKIKT